MTKLLIITRAGQYMIPENRDNIGLKEVKDKWINSEDPKYKIAFINPEEPKVEINGMRSIEFVIRAEDVLQMCLLEVSDLTIVGVIPPILQ